MQAENGFDFMSAKFLGVGLGEIGIATLIIIAFSLGLTLSLKDFARVLHNPKATAAGLLGQLALLPVTAFFIVALLRPDPAIAIGLIVIAACPGGAPSNILTYFAKGDVALAITLTAISSVVAVFTLPIIINIGASQFGVGDDFHLPLLPAIWRLFLLTLAPLAVGMAIRSRIPHHAQTLAKRLAQLSMILLVVTLIIIFASVGKDLPRLISIAAGPTLLLFTMMLAIGHSFGVMLGLNLAERRTIVISVGLQNVMLGIIVTTVMLKSIEAAAVPIIYLLVMDLILFPYVAAINFGWRDKLRSWAA